MSVPELWYYDAGELKIYQLQSDTYQDVKNSTIFPLLPVQELPALIEQYRLQERRALRQGSQSLGKNR